MTHEIETQVAIAASPARVWSLLMDFAGHARWNPFVRSIAGRPAPGERLDLFVQPAGGGGMRFRPVVLRAEPEREFRWKGKLLVPGLFDGEHFFLLEPRADGGVLLRHGERFSGLLVPLFRGSLDGGTRAGFIAMNEALKREAEAGPPVP